MHKIALAGNPNCGKTTLFNSLTDSYLYTGNRPGVTVEAKQSVLKYNKNIEIVDLPGTYSLSPYSNEEKITEEYLLSDSPDMIINVIDASNLMRSLYLTYQLSQLDIPVLIALNMIDKAKKDGITIDAKLLSQKLKCPVVPISALSGDGIKQLSDTAVKLLSQKHSIKLHCEYSNTVENALHKASFYLDSNIKNKRYICIKLLEKSPGIPEHISENTNLIKSLSSIEKRFDKPLNSIIISDAYKHINEIVTLCSRKNNSFKTESISDKIDNIVLNRFLAFPIFFIIVFFIYFLSVNTVGKALSSYLCDNIFAGIILKAIVGFLKTINTKSWLISLISNGIAGSVGTVLSFIPQLIILFSLIAMLEECGYMSRVAFILDRPMRKFGFSGKSAIPFIVGTACSVPGIMSARTIESDSKRKITAALVSFIPCSAKLPVIALLTGTFFPDNPFAAPLVYFIGILSVFFSGIILKKTKLFSKDNDEFIMELPAYQIPKVSGIVKAVKSRIYGFIKKAGSVILLSGIVIWFLSSFSIESGKILFTNNINTSILAKLSGIIAPFFTPLGFGCWQSTAAVIMGLIAKEEIVSVFAVLSGIESETGSILYEIFTPASAYSFLIFNMLCIPCVCAVSAIKNEMNSIKHTLFILIYQTAFAYTVSFFIYKFVQLLI